METFAYSSILSLREIPLDWLINYANNNFTIIDVSKTNRYYTGKDIDETLYSFVNKKNSQVYIPSFENTFKKLRGSYEYKKYKTKYNLIVLFKIFTTINGYIVKMRTERKNGNYKEGENYCKYIYDEIKRAKDVLYFMDKKNVIDNFSKDCYQNASKIIYQLCRNCRIDTQNIVEKIEDKALDIGGTLFFIFLVWLFFYILSILR